MFRLVYDTKSAATVPSVKEALSTVFELETDEELHLDPAEVKGAYNPLRRQYNASKLLNYLIGRSQVYGDALSLWIVSEDLYLAGMNFVFGLAHPGNAAVLSTHRLESLDLVHKEAIHEMGHVLGLQHCTNDCVMQFSNSLDEAKAKPATLCERCRLLLHT
jgi:archaemetzincin